MNSKLDIKEFTRDNNFELWKEMMQVILIQQNCVEPLEDEASMDANLTRADDCCLNIGKDSTIAYD